MKSHKNPDKIPTQSFDLEPDPIIIESKEPELSEAEEKIRRLDRILGSMSPGWRVDVTRKQPGWSAGFLETIDVGEGYQEIDMRYLADTWGGDVLNLLVKDNKGQYVSSVDVPLRSYPPKRWGKVLVNRQIEQDPAAAPASAAGLSLENILGILDRLIKPAAAPELPIGDLFKILLNKSLAPAPAAAPAVSGVQQLVETANALKSLKGLFGDDDRGGGSAEGDIFGQINGLLDSYAKIKGSEPRSIGPVANPSGAGCGVGPGVGGASKSAGGGGPVGSLDLAQIGAAIKSMPPRAIAENMLAIVGSLPEAERTQVFSGIFELLGIDPRVGDEDEDEDEDEPDDLGVDEDEPDDRR